MELRRLGHSGLRVSQVALGTMTFGEDWGFGADRDVCRALFERYAQAGGNFIDTANKYTNGTSERIVGELVGSDRDYWVVASKYSLSMRADDPNAGGNGRKNLMRSVEASLKRLDTDYLDVLWLHAWDDTTPEDEVMRGLDDLVQSGKVLYLGISDTPAWMVSRLQTLAELRGWSRFIGLQIEYSLLERTVERELLPMAKHLGLGVLAWGPLAGGVLTGKYTRHADPSDTTRAAMNTRRLGEGSLKIARTVDAVADQLGLGSATVAHAWLRQQGSQVFPIIGARKLHHLDEALASLEVTLPEEALAALNDASSIDLGFPHAFLRQPDIQRVIFGDTLERFRR